MPDPAAPPDQDAGHEFEHGRDMSRTGQRRALGWALGINAAFLGVEIVAGLVFGSLALLADAAHMVSDVVGLGIALGAVLLTTRRPSIRHSFGFVRSEVLAAQVSALLLVAAGVWILTEAVSRLGEPVPVQGVGLAAVATLGLAINASSAVIIHRAKGQSLNMQASFVHLATDAAGSLAALVAGLAIWMWGWTSADTLASMVTATLVLWTGWALLRESTHVLMEGTPRGFDPDEVLRAIRDVAGVVDVHHLHVWNLSSDVPTASAHIVVAGQPTLRDAQAIADRVRARLAGGFALTHVTLELEDANDPS